MQNLTFGIIFLLAFSACARPNYATQPEVNEKPKVAGQCEQQFSVFGICMNLKWENLPQAMKTTSFTLTFSSVATGAPTFLPGDLDVYLWMPSMGHGSSPVTVAKIDPSNYAVTQVYFVMPGEWQIVVQLKSSNQVLDKVIIPVTLH